MRVSRRTLTTKYVGSPQLGSRVSASHMASKGHPRCPRGRQSLPDGEAANSSRSDLFPALPRNWTRTNPRGPFWVVGLTRAWSRASSCAAEGRASPLREEREPSPSRMASRNSRSPRGDSRDSERKRPLGRAGRGIPLTPSSSAWKWVISANSPTFSWSSSTSARSFC